ncbi:hypothetical protein OG859_13300 [Streptomyces sp. NBC_00048]|uniref:hypothetical protein n=1 Tax=Streptomyces sp. NBC_00048 TaxID=2975628 RepID=UPI00324A8178
MSRRTRSHAAKAATPTTVHIPRQRGRGRRQEMPVIVVVSEEPTLTARATAATGRWVWKHRRSWAPTGLAVALLAVAGIVHLFAPWAAFIAAPAGLAPLVKLGWEAKTRPAADLATTVWRIALATLALAGTAWFSLALWFGPLGGPLMGLWTFTAIAGQVMWLIARRTSTTLKGSI